MTDKRPAIINVNVDLCAKRIQEALIKYNCKIVAIPQFRPIENGLFAIAVEVSILEEETDTPD